MGTMKRELTFYRVGETLTCIDLYGDLHVIPPYQDNFAGNGAVSEQTRGDADSEASIEPVSERAATNERKITP